MIPVVVISLARSTDRRAAITAQLGSFRIPFTFFDAVDGNTMTVAQTRTACRRPNPRRYGTYLLPTEVGCVTSFRLVCEAIARGPDEFVCVLEDDVTLDSKVHTFLDETTLRALPRFDILRIQRTSERWFPISTYGPFTIRVPYRPTYGMCGQIFTRDGAAITAAGLATPWMPGDMMLFYDGIVRGLRILEVDPPLAFHPPPEQDQTTIDPERIRVAPKSPPPLYRRWRRTMYEYASQIRIFRNFVLVWGFSALRLLRQ